MNISEYTKIIYEVISSLKDFENPWKITNELEDVLSNLIIQLNNDYDIKGKVAIHKTATIESNVILKGPVIIGKDCFVAANSYLRGGIFLAENVKVGPSCEIKSSIILNNSTVAHLNFVGNSIIGSNVNLEAGVVLANYFNEREDKTIYSLINGKQTKIESKKFGALIGDDSKIGANAVLSPGTILRPKSIVKRLELIEQVKNK